jgi:hypothetical protein
MIDRPTSVAKHIVCPKQKLNRGGHACHTTQGQCFKGFSLHFNNRIFISFQVPHNENNSANPAMVHGKSKVGKGWEKHEPEISTTKITKKVNPTTPKPPAPAALRILRFPSRIQAKAEAAGKKPERDIPPKVIKVSTPKNYPQPKDIKTGATEVPSRVQAKVEAAGKKSPPQDFKTGATDLPSRIQAKVEAAGKKSERELPPKVIQASTPKRNPPPKDITTGVTPKSGHPPKEIKSALKVDKEHPPNDIKVDAEKPNSDSKNINNDGTQNTDNHKDETNSINSQDRVNMFVSTEELAAKESGSGSPRKNGLPDATVSILSPPTRHLGSTRVPIFSLQDAENRLFDPYLGYNVELRHAFEFPEDVVAENVQVHLGINLERGRGNPRRDELAMGVKAVLREEFRKRFPTKHRRGKDVKNVSLHLRVYVVDVSEGDMETRMLAPECEIGLVRLCLAWMVSSPTGDVVYDGGRIGLTDNMCMGMLDAFQLRTGLACLTNKMAPQLANKIMDRINIQSGVPFYQFW